MGRVTFLEASKVRSYHSTFMEGLLNGYAVRRLQERWGRPRLYAHPSFHDHLGEATRNFVDYRPIAVSDQDKRRLIRKTLLEAWVALRTILSLKRDEVLIVTTILPSALVIVELALKLFRRRNVVVFLHGELEGLVDTAKQNAGSFGFYMLKWLKVRGRRGAFKLAVLDGFIARALTGLAPTIRPEDIVLIPTPMVPGQSLPPRSGPPRCCFIGFKTGRKGYDHFEAMAAQVPAMEFRTIGGGQDLDMRTGQWEPVGSTPDFMAAVARCDFAVFPYTSGYALTISGAATDALSSGVHVLATRLPFFESLAEELGPKLITLCDTAEAIAGLLADEAWVRERRAERGERLAIIAASRYGAANIGQSLDRVISSFLDAHQPATAAALARGAAQPSEESAS